MALGDMRGLCRFLALLALDSVHLSVRNLQGSVPTFPNHRAPTGRRGEGSEEGARGRGVQQSQTPSADGRSRASSLRFRPKVRLECYDLQAFESQLTHLKNRHKNTYHVTCCKNTGSGSQKCSKKVVSFFLPPENFVLGVGAPSPHPSHFSCPVAADTDSHLQLWDSALMGWNVAV